MPRRSSTQDPSAAGTPLWTITGIRSGAVTSPGGNAASGKVITFTLADDMGQGEVRVADGEFSPDHVAPLVHKAALNLLGVLSLQGPTAGEGATAMTDGMTG